jgi:N,N-dimethylformamidase beta subunit-like protein/concanavalin A-like lectin/glucanase superfamily protein
VSVGPAKQNPVTPALLGYADRFSVAPGETIRFMVSAEVPRYRAGLVRLIVGDENPAGPGYQEEVVASTLDGEYRGRRQPLVCGSYVRIPTSPRLDMTRGFTLAAWIWPTTPDKPGGQALISRWSESEQAGFAFGLDDTGHLMLRLGCANADAACIRHPGGPLARWRWAFVGASFDPAAGAVCLWQAAGEQYLVRDLSLYEQSFSGRLAPARGDLLLAARGPSDGLYNGKIDRPRVFSRALTAVELDALRQDESPATDALAAWDFGADFGSDHVRDRSPNTLHGRTINLPTRAVTDHTWAGHETRWDRAPDQYSAIHFHDDDVEDAGWQPDLELLVPHGMRSGVYAARLEANDGGEEYIPFYVRTPRDTAIAPVAFLAPTLTYMAYANERMYWSEGYLEKRSRVTPLTTEPPDIDLFMAEHRELGLSLYDVHSDGSGVSYSSRLRPILNMRPKYRAWRLHDAPRHFAADLYLVGWLEHKGIHFDVITDEDLHHEGRTLLERYRVILTGSHPEYTTEPMHKALRGYLEGGGRLMYLGGNGFYWVTSIDPTRPHVIEIRRGVSGTRAWESMPGESHHSTTGEPGGLWRLRGQAPQRLVGVGFAAQGWGGASGYVREPDSLDPRVAFIFEGIGRDEVIGDFGMVLGGAAGDEIDRFDALLGSPTHALIVATSAGRHTDYYQVTSEDVPIIVPGQGGTESPKVRADMVFFETPNGGAVFSVGSINWLGSLAWNQFDNNVSRITENVLRRFMD